MTELRHFLDIHHIDAGELRKILTRSVELKAKRVGAPQGQVDDPPPLAGRALAMLFEKPSTRTRVSFDMAIRQLGGESVILNGDDMQIDRGESIADTARVLSCYVDAIMIRTFAHETLQELSRNATVPVINGLTDESHPCQLMADVMTFEEHRGAIAGRTIAWFGDGNNMAKTWIHGATRFGYSIRLAVPGPLLPPQDLIDWARSEGADVTTTDVPEAAADGADCIVTDTWVSMGDDAADRHNLLKPFQVDEKLMARADAQAVFMHCLPAHRGEEVTTEVIDGPQSIAFDEAENRLHVQKGILTWCLGN